jgi:hypothetical protein
MKLKQQREMFILILLMASFAPLQAGESGRIHTVTSLGFDPVSRYGSLVAGTGISLYQEVYIGMGKVIQAGVGLGTLFSREIPEEGSLSWQPVYGSVKFFIPQSEVPFYLKGCAGYAFVQGNNAFMTGKTDLRGGLYTVLGGGVDMPFYYGKTVRVSCIFDMGYTSYSGEVKQGERETGISYNTMNVAAGLGMRF